MSIASALLRPLLALLMLGVSLPYGATQAADSAMLVRVGVLQTAGASSAEKGLRNGLRELGYIDGSNIVIDVRRSTGTEQELRALAADLARSNVKMIVVFGSPATRAALQVTTLPVVFIVGDPVATGFAASLAKPGGNGTGVSVLTPELEPKRLDILHQLAPRARRIGYLANLSNPLAGRVVEDLQAAAQPLGLQLQRFDVPTVEQLSPTLVALQRNPPDGLLVSAEAFFLAHSAEIVQAVRKARVPTVFPYRDYVADGALMSYGPDLGHTSRMLAVYVDKILRGSKPADLPIEQMSKYDLVVDMRVAREMGIHIPQQLLLLADEVIW